MIAATVVRAFQAAEWQSYRTFRLQALADSPDAFVTTLAQANGWSDHDWERRLAGLSAEREFPMVAEVNGELAGMAWAHIEANTRTAHLFQMWVAPAHRAQGVGRKLLERGIEWARSCGAEQVVLGVTCGDSPARRLYASCGFKAIGSPEPLRPMSDLKVQNMVLAVFPHAA